MRQSSGFIAVGIALGLSRMVSAGSIPTNFNEYGTNVNGYQDYFNSTTFNPDWKQVDHESTDFTLPGDGTLHMNTASGDPNKLLYNPSTPYGSVNQNVLAMIKVVSSNGSIGTNNDSWRGGVAAVSDASNGQGINAHFRQGGQNGGTGLHINFLDDQKAWGPAVGSNLSADTYYWLRLTTSGTGTTAGTETAEIWPADGTTPESSAITGTWSEGGRSGLAGLVTNSGGGDASFQVNYVLIQASGLPTIQAGATPEPGSLALLAMAGAGLLARRRHTVG